MNFSDIQNIITNLLQLLSNVTNALLNNVFFQTILGLSIFTIILSIIYSLTNKIHEHNFYKQYHNIAKRDKANGYYYDSQGRKIYTK